jgi:FkbM family methyltransferase
VLEVLATLGRKWHAPILRRVVTRLGAGLAQGQVVRARAQDGRRFELRFPRDRGWEILCFTGEFETGTTALLDQLLRPDDVVIDIGANLGWYATLVGARCPDGMCHAFEPSPDVFASLEWHCRTNAMSARVVLNRLALADRPGTATLHWSAQLPHGHASLSSQNGTLDQGLDVPTTTIDRYLEERQLERVDLIKMDVEGAELLVLDGARELLARKTPPMWLVEVNAYTARHFGHSVLAVLERLQHSGARPLIRIPGGWGTAVTIEAASQCQHGDNVLCVPDSHLDRCSAIGF